MKVFINGKIFTVNKTYPIAEAVAIKKNRIVLVGSNDEVKKKVTGADEVIDLNGRLMLPGFIDSHVHFINGGYSLSNLDLRNAKSSSEFIQLIKNYTNSKKVKWITGGNWDHEQWEEKIFPFKEMIDPFTAGRPVFVERIDKHIGLANSTALGLAGIDSKTSDPPGGEIVKNRSTGEPTGILKDNAMTLVYSVIPELSEKEDYQAALLALNDAKINGITSIHDISNNKDISTYLKIEKDDKLSCRIYSILPISSYKNLRESIIKQLELSDKINFKSLKAFSDGSLGADTAWFFEPYENSSWTGLPQDILINGKLNELAFEADKNNLQLAIHAIGDKANASILDLYEKIIYSNSKRNRRFRIEHAQHLRSEDIQRFSNLEVIASCQPYHLFYDGSWAEKKIGSNRIKNSFTFRTLLDSKTKLCFGSDWPVVSLNPLLGIYSAVTRQTSDNKNPDGWIPEQKISVGEAVKCFTLNAAYASFDEHEKGSIENGKLADLVVLNEDIFQIPPDKIKDVKIDMTIFNGEIIYSRDR